MGLNLKKLSLMFLAAWSLGLWACSSPTEDKKPVDPTYTVSVTLVDPPGITELNKTVQVSDAQGTITPGVLQSGGTYTVSGLKAGTYTIQAFGALADGAIYFQASQKETLNSNLSATLSFLESKVLPLVAATKDTDPVAEGTVLKFATLTDSATLRYTTNNTEPLATSTLYSPSAGISVPPASPFVVRIKGFKIGIEASNELKLTYTVNSSQTPTPAFTQAPGNYTSAISLDFTAAPGATVYYTLNGTEPTESSSTTRPISITATTTVKAKAKVAGKSLSATLEGTFNIGSPDKLLPPTFTPGACSFDTTQKVTLGTSAGAQIRYTLNGSTPTETSTLYSGELTLSETTTVKAIAVQTGKTTSDVSEATYTKSLVPVTQTPSFPNHQSGTYTSDQTVSIASEAGAVIYTTINGADPTEASTAGNSVSLAGEGTYVVKAAAKASGKALSPVAQVTITIKYQEVTASPVFTPVPGTYPTGTTISISCPETATIRYTTDGTDPNGTSTVFAGPISAGGSSVTIKAVAYAAGKAPSPVVTARYDFTSGTQTQAPAITPASGSVPAPAAITMTSETGAVIYYTLDGSEPSTSSLQYSAFNLTQPGTYTIKAKGLKTGKTISTLTTATLTVTDNTGYKIYFKHTATPEAYVWYTAAGATVEPFGKWATTAPMTAVVGKSGWYMADLGAKGVASGTAVGVIFKIGSTKIYANDLTRDRTGWCQIVGGLPVWTPNCPDDPQAPSITASPSGGVMGNTQVVDVVINANGSPVTATTYSINGGAAQALSGSKITLDATSLAEGAEMTLTLTSVNAIGPTVLGPLKFTKDTSTVVYPDTLGAVYTKKATKFRLWSPDSNNVTVDVNSQTYTLSKVADFAGYTDVYEVTVPGDLALKPYQFKVNGLPVRDPYGKMIQSGGSANIVMDLSAASTQPTGGWATRPTLVNREDSVVYEVHIRDFTIDPSSGVDAAKRGKFLGMVQTGTSYMGAKTGIDHLKDLGVTHVQILPFYDFGSGMYNWGYDPVNYNIPEDQYAMDPANYEGRIKEVREMVNEFHKNGIRVIMDVVYNHTYGNDMFNGITSKYFTGNNDSGCGNGINTGIPMVKRMIQDSLDYWIGEIGVDGFRFDLIGVFHYAAVNEWGVNLNAKYPDRNLLLYGEPWNGYWLNDPIETQKVRMGTVPAISQGHVGVFNGKYREDIKGNNDGTSKAYMFNAGISWAGAIASGSRGSLLSVKSTTPLSNLWDSMFAYDPEQSINYISAHDNFDLWDKVYLSLSSNVVQADNKSGKEHQVLSFTPPSAATLDYAQRVVKFSMGMIFTSQGIPFLHAGDEFLRTKTNNQDIANASAWQYGNHGTHNTYNAPDSFNSIKWSRKVDHIGIYNYFKAAIALRKANAGLRLTTWDEINSRVQTRMKTAPGGVPVTPDSSLPGAGEVVNFIDQDGNVGNGYELVVVFNPSNNFNITLPAGTWTKVFDIGGAVTKTDTTCEGSAVTVFKKN